MHGDPSNVSECGALLWRNGLERGKDWVPEMKKCPLKMDGVIMAVLRMTRKLAEQRMKKRRRTSPTNKGNWILWFLKLQKEARGVSCKSGATARRWWIGSPARQGKGRYGGQDGSVQSHLRQWLGQTTNLKRREDDWTVLIFVNMIENQMLGADNGVGGVLGRCGIAWSDTTGIV